jgi:phage protein D
MLNSARTLNTIPNNGVTNQPRGIVLINGINVKFEYLEVTTTTFYLSDQYHIRIPLSGQPNNFNANYLSSVHPITVKIYMGFPSNPNFYSASDLQLLLIGDVDKLDIDPITMTASFSGRDLTSRLINTKTYAKYSNQTSSTIVTNLAKAHNLTPVVTQTNTPVGTFYQTQNTLLTKETTEWDLVCFLAQEEGFVIYVEGENLIFKPRPIETSSTPYLLTYQPPTSVNGSPTFNGESLLMSRSLTLAQDVIVLVRVPYSPSGKAFTVKATSAKRNSSALRSQTFVLTYPGLTRAQAAAKANQLALDITSHELKIQVKLPGDTLLKKDSLIQLRGTNTMYDQIYFTDMVTRTFEFNSESGFSQIVSAKNHSVDNQVNL